MLQALKYDPGRNYSILCFCHNLIRFVVVSKMEITADTRISPHNPNL